MTATPTATTTLTHDTIDTVRIDTLRERGALLSNQLFFSRVSSPHEALTVLSEGLAAQLEVQQADYAEFARGWPGEPEEAGDWPLCLAHEGELLGVLASQSAVAQQAAAIWVAETTAARRRALKRIKALDAAAGYGAVIASAIESGDYSSLAF